MSTNSPPPGAHRPTAWIVLGLLLTGVLAFIGHLADLDSLRNNWGWRALLLLIAVLLLVAAFLLWWRSQPGRARLVLTAVLVVAAIAVGTGAWFVPQGESNTYAARVETRADSTRFVEWLYAHYEQPVDLKVEIAREAASDQADPNAMTQPRRIAIHSDTCGSATLGQDQLVTNLCCPSPGSCPGDLVLGLTNPYRDDPSGVDLSWTGGGVGAWTIRGTFVPVAAQGPSSGGVWFIQLEERIPGGAPPR